MSMDPAIMSVTFTGFGFQDIGVGITIIKSGFTVITHHAKSAHFLTSARRSDSDGLFRHALDAR